ncbi:MAG: DHH family phosphoesterase [Bacillota bacterium]|nr:DHH family phosphoesterase [Bacillota bacterium]
MKERFLDKLVEPRVPVTAFAAIVLICFLMWYNILLGGIGILLLGGAIVYEGTANQKRKKDFSNYIENLAAGMDSTVKKNIVTNPLPICIVNKQGFVEWYNRKFGEFFLDDEELVYKNIHTLIPAIKIEEYIKRTPEDTPLQVSVNERVYKIISGNTGEEDDNLIVLYFVDVTAFENLKKMHRDEKSCAVHIWIDNYEEIMLRAPEEKKAILPSQIEVKIRQFAQKNMAPLIKYDDEKYYLILDNKHLDNIIENKFAILDEVREIETGTDLPVSLSIGVGASGKSYLQNHEYSQAAIELALGRGGDQAAVKKINKTDFYGGRLQAVEKRNKGKSRIMSHALQRLIEQSSGVLIMGHKNADMDSFGAAVGIQAIAKKYGKNSGIVMDFVGESLASLYEYVKSSGNFNIINSEHALSFAEKDTLLVVVDTHSPAYTECPDLLKKVEKIVVIDHHRKQENSIENPVLAYMESYASSTCELVAEIIQYTGDKNIMGKVEADALMAGITLDTKHFSSQTGVRTFEAASYLRRLGADSTKIRSFFQVDSALFRVKAKAIMNAELIKLKGSGSIAITVCEGRDDNIGLITAQTADEMLEIKGVRAAVVLGENRESEVMISARSIGDINVQVLMEKMGGGGHLNVAGAQVKMSVREAEAILKQIINNEIAEERSKK